MTNMQVQVITPTQIREILSKMGEAGPKKGLAQHFLINSGSLGKVARAGDITANDIVSEVGPGLGVLTAELVKRARKVIAVEIDDPLCDYLRERFASASNLRVINHNIMGAALESLFDAGDEASPYKVIANLPYYIAPAVVRRFLESPRPPTLLVVMVQKEVANNMVAGPGDRSMLSIAVQLYGAPKIVGTVKPGAFYPPPKVDSAIVRIDVFPEPALKLASHKEFFRVVGAGFHNARKQLRNSLAIGLGLDSALVEQALAHARVEQTRRAETLTLAEWGRIYEALSSRVDESARDL